MQQIVLNGNNIDLLKNYPDNYFDAVVTDPPYGLGKEPNAEALMIDWIEKGYHEVGGTGFMGKEWDAFVPQPIFWKEVFRVLKHGGHVVSFFGSRTYDWGVMAMRFANFEVRDTITWHFGSGFPKSHNVSKSIDKLKGAEREVVGSKITGTMNNKGGASVNKEGWDGGQKEVSITAPSSDEAKQWDGWGTALKPASEYIVLARKPLEKGLSIAENVLKWGVGGINIDGCRVGFTDNVNMGAKQSTNNLSKVKFFDDDRVDFEKPIQTYKSEGRFPANLILTHHPECECVGMKKVKPSNGSGKASDKGGGFSKGMFGDGTSDNIGGGFADENGEETIEDWYCHPDCPIRILDEQSGVLKSGDMNGEYHGFGNHEIYGKAGKRDAISYGDKGGASRFFYCAKSSKSERNKGLDGFEEKTSGSLNFRNPSSSGRSEDAPSVEAMGGLTKPNTNFHPTVKPIKLMQYLARLITPPNGIVLDPFCGSGTTGIACKLEGFEFVGMEQDAEYTKIAQARIENYKEGKGIKQRETKKDATPNELINQLNLF